MTENKDTLIHRILSGEGSQSDKEELDAWMSADPRNAEEFQDMKLLFESTAAQSEEREDDIPTKWLEIEARVNLIRRRQRRLRIYKVFGIAFLIGMSVFIAFLNAVGPASIRSASSGTEGQIQLRRSIVFAEMPLADVLGILEDECDVTFLVANNELLSSNFTGTFSRGTAFQDLIQIIGQSENVTFVKMSSATFRLTRAGDTK